MRFAALTERIHAILKPRIEAFTKLNVFKDIEQKRKPGTAGPRGARIPRENDNALRSLFRRVFGEGGTVLPSGP